MREQSGESVAALRRLLHEFAAWVWRQAQPRRWLHGGQREVFFDDTRLEVCGKPFEGAAINYNGDLALSWQTLWVGPLLADSQVGSPADVSGQLLPMLGRNRSLWQGQAAHFYADSGSSAGHYLDAIAAEGWHYTVSYNKSTGPLERTAQALPSLAWKENGGAHHAFLRHQPEGRNAPQLYAVSRRRDGLFDRYGFIACDKGQTDAARVGERHHLKGGKEQLFSEVLNGLDLHRPPSSALIANQIYYLIGALAYDLMVAIKLLDLNDDCQGWRIKTLMKKLVMLPGRLSWRSRQWVARVLVPGAWLCWWQRWAGPGATAPGRGHGLKEPASNIISRPMFHRHGGALPRYQRFAKKQTQNTCGHPRHLHVQGKTNPRLAPRHDLKSTARCGEAPPEVAAVFWRPRFRGASAGDSARP